MAKKQTKRKVANVSPITPNWPKYVLVILGVILAFSVLNWKPTVRDTGEIEITSRVKVPAVTVPLKESSSLTEKRLQSEPLDARTKDLLSSLVQDYFKSYMGSNAAYEDQVSDYAIHSFTGRMTKSQLLVEVNYSVKPVVYNSFWYSGTGSPSNDGWIHNKYGCSLLRKDGDTYTRIDSLGTGCNFTE